MYHSALKGFKEFDRKSSYVKTSNITAFVFDIEQDNIPEEFYFVDFVYLDLPYKKGYDIFNQRAFKKGRGYKFLLLKTLSIIYEIKKPFYIIGEKNIKQLKPLLTKELIYSVHKCKTYLYTNDGNIDVNTTDDLLTFLFDKYDVGLDFMCGYGNTGRKAIEKNKKAILTDYNENCIGYINENLH